MKKRVLAMFLALVMCLALTVPAFAAYDYANGKCTYELSNEIIGTVEIPYPDIFKEDGGDSRETVTAFVVPDNTVLRPKSMPDAGLEIYQYNSFIDDWVWGAYSGEPGEPLVVEAYMHMGMENDESEKHPVAYWVWMKDGDHLDDDNGENSGIRVIAESAAKSLGLAISTKTYDHDNNGKCTYELSNDMIGTVEMDYHGEGTVTVYVVPDYTTIIPKNAPGARILSTYYLFDGWVAGSFELSNTDDPMVVRPILVQEGEEIEGGWLAFALLTEDVNAQGYDPDPDELPENFLDWDEEKFGEGAFRVISESAAKGLGLTIQPITPDKPAVPATAQAAPTTQKLLVNGKERIPAAYNINNSNYFKIRDVAALLIGTEKEFGVDYDDTTRAVTIFPEQKYEKKPTDLQGRPTASGTAMESNDVFYCNGVQAPLGVYKVNNTNYVKLRDLAKLLDFYVKYDEATRSMIIDTAKPYTD